MPSRNHYRPNASRAGRYRKLLVSPESLAPVSKNVAAVFCALDEKRSGGVLSDAEFLSYGLLTLLLCRRPDALQRSQTRNGKHILSTSPPGDFTLADFWKLLASHHVPIAHYPQNGNPEISVLTFLQGIRFRGIPDAARLALLAWLNHRYPLTLLFHVPSAPEVFALQIQGRRCVSFFRDERELTMLHHDRDVISFIVHDLIHAHTFYAQPQRARQQIGFYHWIHNIQNDHQLTRLQAESPSFLTSWEYILSDMNSYCGHLLKTLHAAFMLHAKLGEGELMWQHIINTSNLAPNEKILFQKINSPDWCHADFLHLETIFEKRAQDAIPVSSRTHPD